MKRRDFIKMTALAMAGLGLGSTLSPAKAQAEGELIALLPEGQIYTDQLLELVKHLGYRGRWEEKRLDQSLPADLLLFAKRSLQDPSRDFNAEARRFRAHIHGHQATRLLRLQHGPTTTTNAKSLRVLSAHGEVQYSLDASLKLEIPSDLGKTYCAMTPDGLRVTQAACKHEHCCSMGPIAKPGERIVCAPASLILEIA